MDGQAAMARRRADRRLVRQLARRYWRERDLDLALPGKIRDYERRDKVCRWITAGLIQRLSAALSVAIADLDGAPATLEVLLLRACLRGEVRRYRSQTRERQKLLHGDRVARGDGTEVSRIQRPSRSERAA